MKPFLFALTLSLLASPAFARWAERPRGTQTITVILHSSPEGAGIYINDARTFVGTAPIAVTYRVQKKGGCQRMQGAEARWASGATTAVDYVMVCPEAGKRQQSTFTRPVEAPNASADYDLAMRQQELALLQQLANQPIYVPPPVPLWQPYIYPKTSFLCLTRPITRSQTYVWCQ